MTDYFPNKENYQGGYVRQITSNWDTLGCYMYTHIYVIICVLCTHDTALHYIHI